jgi:hypothetical protein
MNRSILAAAGAMLLAPTIAAPAHAGNGVWESCGAGGYSQNVQAGPGTSCAFAIVVANQTAHGGGDYISATSPVTGQTYNLHCWIKQHGAVTCENPADNIEVVIH